MLLIISSLALAGIATTSWEEGSEEYPVDYTPAEVDTWAVDADLPQEMLFSGWIASWQEGTETLFFSGLEDGSICLVEEGDYGYVERVSPVADAYGQVVGWGWGSAYEDEVEEELVIHSWAITGVLTGAETFAWSASTGWGEATGPDPETPPAGAPWSIVASTEGEALTLAADRLSWEVGPDGLSLLQFDASGSGLDLGSTVTITVSWLSE